MCESVCICVCVCVCVCVLVCACQWRRKMFWDRGAGAEAAQRPSVCARGARIFFWIYHGSCEEAALVASSYYIEGQALTHCTRTLLLSMDAPAAMYMVHGTAKLVSCTLAPPPCETHETTDKRWSFSRKTPQNKKALAANWLFVAQRRNRYVSAPSVESSSLASDCL